MPTGAQQALIDANASKAGASWRDSNQTVMPNWEGTPGASVSGPQTGQGAGGGFRMDERKPTTTGAMPGGAPYFPGQIQFGQQGTSGASTGSTWNPQGPRPTLNMSKVGALPELQLPEYNAPERDTGQRSLELKQSAMRPGMRGLEESFQKGRLNMDYMSSPTGQKEYIRGLMGGMSEGIERVAGQAGDQAVKQYEAERADEMKIYDTKYGLKQRQTEVNYRQSIDKILKNVDISNVEERGNFASATDEYFTAGKAGDATTSGSTTVAPSGVVQSAWDKMDPAEQAAAARRSRVQQSKDMMVYQKMGTNPFGSTRYGYRSIYDSQAGMV